MKRGERTAVHFGDLWGMKAVVTMLQGSLLLLSTIPYQVYFLIIKTLIFDFSTKFSKPCFLLLNGLWKLSYYSIFFNVGMISKSVVIDH